MSDSPIMSETESYIEKMAELEASKSVVETVEAEVNIVVDEYQEPIQLVVKAGEILENGDAHSEEDSSEEIPTPEGAVVLVVEAGEILDGAEEKEEEEEYTYSIENGGECSIEPPKENEVEEEEYTYELGNDGECSIDPPKEDDGYSYTPREDAASSSDTGSKSQEQYYRDNGYPEPEETVSGPVPAERSPTEPAAVAVEENRIASLHEVVDTTDSPAVRSAPVPAPRKAEPAAKQEVVNASSAAAAIKVQSYAARNEDEDSFEAMVKQNIRQYKSEKSKTNAEVLASIEKEDGEDRPQANKLLAWAKSTRKPKTETMVVRQKKRDDKIRQAVDFGGVNVVVSDKAAQKKAAAPAEEKKTTSSPFKKPVKAKVDSAAVTTDRIRTIMASVLPGVVLAADSCSITEKSKGHHEVNFKADRPHRWLVVNNEMHTKDTKIRGDLAKKMTGFSGSTKLPLTPLIYVDNYLSVFDEDPTYKPHAQDRPLDEIHLKIGMRALARLHAISFVYLARGGDAEAIKLLSRTNYTDPNTRSETKASLESNLDAVVSVLSKGGSSTVEQVKTLKNSLFNIYKEAESPSSSLLPVLCHGLPTLQNVLFQYGPDNLPRDARFVNLDTAMYSSALTDLHLFINTSGENSAREDFLLRFVYFETLVSCLKAAGEKVGFNYDDLKSEFTKKRLYGYIKSASILAAKETGGRKVTPAPTQKVSAAGPKVVESKILGNFIPKAKVSAVASFSKAGNNKPGDKMENASKIQDMMQKAVRL